MAIRGLLSTIAIFWAFGDATPTITFPLNSQVPPIARISEPFSYTFSTSTFFSIFPITYVLSSGPTWLSLDNITRTISGTPPKMDLGTETVFGIPIGITASDSTGSVSLNSTLVVSKNSAPAISISASSQLPSFGLLSLPSTLLYHPSSPFKFKFDPGTFSGSGLSYYAVTTDNTPLPSWVIFDGSDLSFSGQTPDYASLIQPPQVFGVRLIASDVEGFAGTSISFEIEVGVHLLAIESRNLVINATGGTKVNYTGLAEAIQIDGRGAKVSEIISAIAKTPYWLTFDNTTLTFSGKVPDDAVPYNISVDVTDVYEDSANATILIDVPTAIFSNEIGDLNATIGSAFNYDLSTCLHDPSDIEMTIDISGKQPWIFFDSKSFLLSGNVPNTAEPSEIGVSLIATSKSSRAAGSQSFKLFVSKAISKPSPTAETTSKIAPSATGNLIPLPAQSHNRLSTGVIVAISVPLSLLFIAIVLALSCYIFRRRATRRRPRSPSKSEISNPHETPSSVVEITRPTKTARAVPPPQPLQLDMSGFGRPTSSVVLSPDYAYNHKWKSQQMLRRSQTASAIPNPRLSRMLRESDTSGNRMRSHSENALTNTESRWSSTQESAYRTVRSSQTRSSHRLTREYSNYSRKGHTRRSARVVSANFISTLRESTETGQPLQPPQTIQPQPGDSILNLQDSNFSMIPIDNFSALSTQGDIKYLADTVPPIDRASRPKSTKRRSRFMPNIGLAATGIGHGGRESTLPLSGEGGNRRSVGHGQDWVAPEGLSRDSRTWLKVDTAEESQRQNRRSNTSNYSAYPETLAIIGPNLQMSIRVVPKSSSITSTRLTKSLSSRVSNSSLNSRPVSRRVGSSPFFGSSSMSNSRKLSKKMRTSYADSPTVPEEAIMPGLEETILRGMREMGDEPHRDSFGISFGLAREGTRQLRSYIQGQSHRSQTRESMKSFESKDSRFESATNSILSLPQLPQNPYSTLQIGRGNEYEEYLAEDAYSENSWETNHTTQDGQGNVVEYAPADSPEVTMAAAARARARASFITSVGGGGLTENPVRMDGENDIGPGARMVPGALRRPISVDAGTNRKRSSRVLLEGGGSRGDYTAYI